MHPADIKAALQKKGLSQVVIARQAVRGKDRHVHKSAVSRVINGSLKSVAIAKSISQAIGLPVAVIFPGKYPALEIIEARGLTAEKITADLAARQTRTRRKAVAA